MNSGSATHIGPSIHIKGVVTADESLTIAGRLDGTVEVNGHALTVAMGGQLTAKVTADTIIVRGGVNGNLTAHARIVVDETAQIEGDLQSPALSIADGALVHGIVETTAIRATTAPGARAAAAPSAA